MKTIKMIDHLYCIAQQQLQKQNELISSQFLSPLFGPQYPYLPQSQGSIDNHSLLIIINDILLHQRQSIIEFGSGISTILIGRLIRKNGLDTRLISVENDVRWAEILR
jgi:hypothetical protein